ncbi:P26-2 protein [Gynaephora ruoergensis nucleopolyhedrovirus]|nr:P26-2 protein [Gynaephora ruoergensis nucleopolyhedrovirus]
MNVFIVNDTLMEVDFNFRRVRCLKYKNKPIFVKIHSSSEAVNHAEDKKMVTANVPQEERSSEINVDDDAAHHHYPGMTCSLKLPKVNAGTTVKVVRFNDKNKTVRVESVRLDSCLYYAHHRRGNVYVLGLVPAIVMTYDKTANSAAESIFLGSPVFNADNRLISFITDHYLDSKTKNDETIIKEILPVSGESYRLQSAFSLTGKVRIYYENDLANRKLSPSLSIDIDVIVRRNQVEVFVIYNKKTISYLKIKCKYAGNVLVV